MPKLEPRLPAPTATSAASQAPQSETKVPPYIPWKSFDNFVGTLKSTHAPDVIDPSVMPQSMAGGLQSQVRNALKFLGLTNDAGKVSPGFAELIAAHGTPQWPAAVKEHVLPSYDTIIGDLPIENATAAQLDAKFRDRGVSTGQMLDKTTRFYLHALKSAEVKYSKHWSIRNESGPRKRSVSQKSPATRKSDSTESRNNVVSESAKEHESELLEFPLYFGDKPSGKVCVPRNMDDDDIALFDATVAVVKAYCARKKSSGK